MANTAFETMFGFLPQPAYMPCPECGVSLSRDERDGHVCDAVQRARYALFQLRGEIERFELELAGWLQSVNGRFEVFYAAWQRDHT
jgi:hypothetical protein